MPARWDETRTAAWLRVPGADDHKYRRGVLGARTGSAAYPGAAVLGVAAAWRAGIGMVRYVPPVEVRRADHGLPSPAAAVLAAHPETVFGEGSGRPCDAWLIGSGTDAATRPDAETSELRAMLTGDAPVVVDAGALGLTAEIARSGEALAPAVLTPHFGEFTGLWVAAGLGETPDAGSQRSRAAGVARLAEALGATVLLKGSVTITAAPGAAPVLVGPATAWLATAGTGDVLAGTLGALVAAHADAVRQDPALLAELGAAAAHLHDAAARIASGGIDDAAEGRPITALDAAHALPAAFARLRAGELSGPSRPAGR
ncbi:NAD(P)H-hydrate dehydratase [Leucobacter sp. gxy201]|uniref:ADP-dependent NAD(P)H-hydrate dehydratase n=1 Tax=Leucobacter sp. gxy201 TaxID=2957200 RepID=UPI003D9FBC33